MSKKRSNSKRPRGTTGRPIWMWATIVGLVALAAVWVSNANEGHAQHPAPRPDVTGEQVLSALNVGTPRVRHAYAVAAAIPETLDGIFCYCYCSLSSDHRSLLVCFESEHGSRCDICMDQAETAYRLLKEGKDLSQIRAATDAAYGRQ